MGATFSQFFPPKPTLTERNLPRQDGKTFMITGGASGVGYELAAILYAAGAKVYIAGRSEAKARAAIDAIRAANPAAPEAAAGQLEFLFVDLADLASIKPAAQEFQRREARLDVLWNNAGVSLPPAGSVSAQGHELQLATNCLGPWLLTQLLLPVLRRTAAQAQASASPGAVRVVWTSSFVVDLGAPRGGFDMAEIRNPPRDATRVYGHSKTGNWFLAAELARTEGANADVGAGDGAGETRPDAILSVTANPGNLSTALLRHHPWLAWLSRPLLYPARMGAYTELWAGLAAELSLADGSGYVVPWGRVHPAPRADLTDALRGPGGGGGRAEEFRRWCEERTADYV